MQESWHACATALFHGSRHLHHHGCNTASETSALLLIRTAQKLRPILRRNDHRFRDGKKLTMLRFCRRRLLCQSLSSGRQLLKRIIQIGNVTTNSCDIVQRRYCRRAARCASSSEYEWYTSETESDERADDF